MGALILTGTRAAGKTTLARRLLLRDPRLRLVQAVTTRQPRDDDEAGTYAYTSGDQFDQLERNDDLVVNTRYAGKRYGITRHALTAVELAGHAPLLIITPESTAEVLSRAAAGVTLVVFVDANDAVLNARLRQRSGALGNAVIGQRVGDRSYRMPGLRLLSNDGLLDDAVDLVARWWEEASQSTSPVDQDLSQGTSAGSAEFDACDS